MEKKTSSSALKRALDTFMEEHVCSLNDEKNEVKVKAALKSSELHKELAKVKVFPCDEVNDAIATFPFEPDCQFSGRILRLLLESEFELISQSAASAEEAEEEEEEEEEVEEPVDDDEVEGEEGGLSAGFVGKLVALSPIDPFIESKKDGPVLSRILKTKDMTILVKDTVVGAVKTVARWIKILSGFTLLDRFIEIQIEKRPDSRFVLYLATVVDAIQRILAAALTVWMVVSRPDKALWR